MNLRVLHRAALAAEDRSEGDAISASEGYDTDCGLGNDCGNSSSADSESCAPFFFRGFKLSAGHLSVDRAPHGLPTARARAAPLAVRDRLLGFQYHEG